MKLKTVDWKKTACLAAAFLARVRQVKRLNKKKSFKEVTR